MNSDTPIPLDRVDMESLVECVVATAAEKIFQANQGGLSVSRAWTYQDDKQVKKHGKDKASWYCGWLDPDGARRCKSCGPGATGKRSAEKLRRQVEAQLLTGTYQSNHRKTWAEFRQQYAETIVPGFGARTREEVVAALAHFERLARPGRMSAVKTTTIDTFIAARRQERGKKPGSTVSPATVNKELRHLRAALKKAKKWSYIPESPDFDFLREPGKLPRYVTVEHFAAIYAACDVATLPTGHAFAPADWWRAVLAYLYLTGWRIGELLALPKTDLDLEAGCSITRAADNKGKVDVRVPLHPAVLCHLRTIPSFGERVFPWPINGNPDWKKELYGEFARIQTAAGIKLVCPERHQHTEACHRYGFHDLRRAFATENADQLTPDALQKLMRHKSYTTTQLYINMNRQLKSQVEAIKVPDVLRKLG